MTKHIHTVKTIIKLSIAYALFYSGLIFLIKRLKLNNRVVVLTYHRILPFDVREDSFSHPAIMVDDQNFERQIRFIRKHFKVMTTRQLQDKLASIRPDDEASCLITFDDGWRDNYDHAYPILKKHRVPALIFPAMNYIGKQDLFWQEALGHGIYQVFKTDSDRARQFIQHHKLDYLHDLDKPEQLEKIQNYVRVLKALDYDEIDAIFEQIGSLIGDIDFGAIDGYLSPEQIAEMRRNGIEFGSHACSHRILTRLSDSALKEELEKSRVMLEAITNQPVDTIAYPNGDFDDRVVSQTRAAGYSLGFGTRFGYVSAGDNAYELKRININDSTSRNNPLLLAMMLGVF